MKDDPQNSAVYLRHVCDDWHHLPLRLLAFIRLVASWSARPGACRHRNPPRPRWLVCHCLRRFENLSGRRVLHGRRTECDPRRWRGHRHLSQLGCAVSSRIAGHRHCRWNLVGHCYTKIQPFLERTIGLHDTCGVNNLHGMPGILAAICSVFVCAFSKSDHFASTDAWMAVYGPRFDDDGAEIRSAGEQAGFQMLCLIVSFSIAVITGAISGFIVKFIDPLKETDGYLDSAHWEVPEQEIPFFYDRRGEIDRDMLKARIAGLRKKEVDF